HPGVPLIQIGEHNARRGFPGRLPDRRSGRRSCRKMRGPESTARSRQTCRSAKLTSCHAHEGSASPRLRPVLVRPVSLACSLPCRKWRGRPGRAKSRHWVAWWDGQRSAMEDLKGALQLHVEAGYGDVAIIADVANLRVEPLDGIA